MSTKRTKQTKRRCRSLLSEVERNYSILPCDGITTINSTSTSIHGENNDNNNNRTIINGTVVRAREKRSKSSFSQRFISAAHEIVHEVFHPKKNNTYNTNNTNNRKPPQKSPSSPDVSSENNTVSDLPAPPPSTRKPTIQSTSISQPSTRRNSQSVPASRGKPKGATGNNRNNRGNRGNRNNRRNLKKSIPALRCYVPKYLLEGGTAPPFKRSTITRFFRALHPNVAVNVERIESGLSASVLYSPEIPKSSPRNNRHGFISTSLVTNRPTISDPNLVYRDSPYEVRVSGMMVCDYDTWGNDNELLMYSVQNDGANHGEQNETLPYIHFDYQRDGIAQNEKPNCYIPIPASKSYVVSSTGKHKCRNGPGDKRSKNRKSINVQFRILELDDPSPGVKAAVKGIDEFGGALNMLDPVAPFIGALTPALSLAGAVSKRALDSYAQPDKVISIDMDFLLADKERVRSKTASPGEYLRYGYYFFLSEPVEGKLWASVRTPKNVQLMLRQHSRKVGELEYFPLTEVSYLVVRVTEPTDSGIRRNRRPVQLAHAHQLESIFQQSKQNNDPQAVQNAVKQLGKDLGVLHSDDDTDDDAVDAASPASPPATSIAAATAAKVM